jgi:archaemetzincin
MKIAASGGASEGHQVPMEQRKVVGLIPSIKVPPLTLEILAGNIQGLLLLPTDVLTPFDPPENCFDRIRNQVNAGLLLHFLAEQQLQCFRIVGIVSFDLFLPIFTHVYGEAQMPGRAAVISLFRLGIPQDGMPPPERETILTRASKVVVHELLHTFGLAHCRQVLCLMRPVTKVSDLDDLPLYLCRSCRYSWQEKVQEYGLGSV